MEITNRPGGEDEAPVAQNPNPAANENLPDDTHTTTEQNTDIVGSEITDGEDA